MDTSKTQNPQPQSLSPSSSGRQRSSVCNSPEFEFWMVRNPSFPQPNLLSADELFVDGVLLPLHLLRHHNIPDRSGATPRPDHETFVSEPPDPEPEPPPEPSPAITDSTATTSFSASKRWKDIFKKSEKKSEENSKTSSEEKGKKKKKEKKKSANGAGSAAELNINIWPFSRSRSAGNASTRPKLFPGAPVTRKVNSAPCSRSNSAGESKSRKWPSSPGRAGVHVGRSSPVWQVRRAGSTSKNSEPTVLNGKGSRRETPTNRRSKTSTTTPTTGAGSAKARVLNLNVPVCIGYRHHLSCRSDDKAGAGAGSSAGAAAVCGVSDRGGVSNAAGSGGNLFNLRSLFTKKSMVTSH